MPSHLLSYTDFSELFANLKPMELKNVMKWRRHVVISLLFARWQSRRDQKLFSFYRLFLRRNRSIFCISIFYRFGVLIRTLNVLITIFYFMVCFPIFVESLFSAEHFATFFGYPMVCSGFHINGGKEANLFSWVTMELVI